MDSYYIYTNVYGVGVYIYIYIYMHIAASARVCKCIGLTCDIYTFINAYIYKQTYIHTQESEGQLSQR